MFVHRFTFIIIAIIHRARPSKTNKLGVMDGVGKRVKSGFSKNVREEIKIGNNIGKGEEARDKPKKMNGIGGRIGMIKMNGSVRSYRGHLEGRREG
jgi:hypothetical protein